MDVGFTSGYIVIDRWCHTPINRVNIKNGYWYFREMRYFCVDLPCMCIVSFQYNSDKITCTT